MLHCYDDSICVATADCLYFDECIDAKQNRYLLRRLQLTGDKIETPFLNSDAGKHVKTYVPPYPDNSNVPDNSTFTYSTFPILK